MRPRFFAARGDVKANLSLFVAVLSALGVIVGAVMYYRQGKSVAFAVPVSASTPQSDEALPQAPLDVETPTTPDLRGSDPMRFANCDRQLTGVTRMACLVGGAAYAISAQHPDQVADKAEMFKTYAAVEAATRVRSALSSGRYAYLTLRGNLPSGSESCLEEGAGICGNQVEAFLAIMDALGIDARPVQFFYTTNGVRESHIAAEVFFLDSWRFIDVTWGFVAPPDGGGVAFKSLAEIRAQPGTALLENSLDAWSLFARASHVDPMAYLRRPDVDIVVDGMGTVSIRVPSGSEVIERFSHVPNYVGDNSPEPDIRHTSLRVIADGKYRVSLRLSGQAGCRPEEGDRLLINGKAFSVTSPSVVFDMDHEAMLSMRTRQQTCYVVFSEARFAALP
jgi:hypothetical protein